MNTRPSTEELHALIEARLRRIGQRYTGGRRALVEYLANCGHPVSIADITDALPELPRSSAYRHLVKLQDAGVARRIAASDDFARFELAEHLTEHHHHLICTSCGKVLDVTPTTHFERVVNFQIKSFTGRAGFEPSSHLLDVFGTCADCR